MKLPLTLWHESKYEFRDKKFLLSMPKILGKTGKLSILLQLFDKKRRLQENWNHRKKKTFYEPARFSDACSFMLLFKSCLKVTLCCDAPNLRPKFSTQTNKIDLEKRKLIKSVYEFSCIFPMLRFCINTKSHKSGFLSLFFFSGPVIFLRLQMKLVKYYSLITS